MSTAPPPAVPAEEKPEGGEEPKAPNPQHISAQKRVQQQRAQVDEVVDIMRTNVEKVLERDKKLSDLQQSADALEEGASQFEKQACKLKSKFWWKNCKMLAIMIGIGIVIVIIIVETCSRGISDPDNILEIKHTFHFTLSGDNNKASGAELGIQNLLVLLSLR